MSERRPPRIFLSVGEHSGDLHGSLILSHLRQLAPDLVAEGIGGPLMEKQGFRSLHSIDELAVIGFVEVLANLRRILGIFGDVKEYLRAAKPDLVILIDYPGFNVRVAQAAKTLGLRVLYYILPQVWAWNPGRTQKIARTIDEAVVVFPFETEIWRKVGASCHWFGHPLVGIVESRMPAEQFREELNIGEGPIISILPGSRHQEIRYILPALLDAATLILAARPNARFLLPQAPTIDEELIRPHLKGRNLPLTLLRGQTYDAVKHSDLALVASGTATLETALLGTPMIIVYQTNFVTSVLSKFLIQAPHIGLPNVVAGEKIVPEFIRWHFQPEQVAREALAILDDPVRQKLMREKLQGVKGKLGEPGASRRVAEHLLEVIRAGEGEPALRNPPGVRDSIPAGGPA